MCSTFSSGLKLDMQSFSSSEITLCIKIKDFRDIVFYNTFFNDWRMIWDVFHMHQGIESFRVIIFRGMK